MHEKTNGRMMDANHGLSKHPISRCILQETKLMIYRNHIAEKTKGMTHPGL